MLILETSVARVEDQPSKPAATPPATEDGERRA
jgi:hypothetical protein